MSQDDAEPVLLHRAVSIRTNEPCAFLTIKREHYKLALERTKAVVVRAKCGCCIAKRASLTYALAPQQEDIRSLLLSSKLFQGLDPEQVDAFVGGVRSTMGRAAAFTCYSPNTASVTTTFQVRREKIISGRVIVRQGKPLPGVYFVRRGRCTIVKDNPGAAASGLGATAAAATDATAAASARDMSSQQQQTQQPQQQQRERGGAITSVGSSLQFAQQAMEAQVVDASADAKTTRSRNRFLLQQAAKHRVVDLKFQSDVRVASSTECVCQSADSHSNP